MTAQAIVDKIRLYVGDTKETRFNDALLVSEMNNCLGILSEATKAKVERAELIQVIANKTVYNYSTEIIETTRFEQLSSRVFGEKLVTYTESAVETDNIPVLREADLASRNYEPVDDLEIVNDYGFRRDTSKSTIVAVIKDSLAEHKLEIYPRLTNPEFTVTQEMLDFWNANGDIDTSSLTVGTHAFIPLIVYYSAYFDIVIDAANLDATVNMTAPLIRMLEHMTAAALLGYDTNSSSMQAASIQMEKYRGELKHFQKRQASSYHKDKDRRYKVRKRTPFTTKLTSEADYRDYGSDFGHVLPIN